MFGLEPWLGLALRYNTVTKLLNLFLDDIKQLFSVLKLSQ